MAHDVTAAENGPVYGAVAIFEATRQHHDAPPPVKPAGMTGTDQDVLVRVADHAGKDNVAWMSVETLAVETWTSPSTVQRSLAALTGCRMLIEQCESHRNGAAVYSVDFAQVRRLCQPARLKGRVVPVPSRDAALARIEAVASKDPKLRPWYRAALAGYRNEDSNRKAMAAAKAKKSASFGHAESHDVTAGHATSRSATGSQSDEDRVVRLTGPGGQDDYQSNQGIQSGVSNSIMPPSETTAALLMDQPQEKGEKAIEGGVTRTRTRRSPKRVPTHCPASSDPGADAWLAAHGIPSLSSDEGNIAARMLDGHAAVGKTEKNWLAAFYSRRKNGDDDLGPADGHDEPTIPTTDVPSVAPDAKNVVGSPGVSRAAELLAALAAA